MTDPLETKLSEAKELLRVSKRTTQSALDCLEGFNAAAAIAREVVAEKDAEIARLKNELNDAPCIVRVGLYNDERCPLRGDEHDKAKHGHEYRRGF